MARWSAVFTPQLCADLWAMRGLPPGTLLPRPADPDQGRLFGELLALPDVVDPVRWLAKERRAVTAAVGLRFVLRDLVCTIDRLRRASSQSIAAAIADEAALSGPLEIPDDAPPLVQLRRGVGLDATQLRKTLGELRSAAGLVGSNFTDRPDQERPLWLELLALSDVVDPLEWLMRARGDDVTYRVLAHLLDQCRPPRDLDVGPIAHGRAIRHTVHDSRRLRAEIVEIGFGAAGFTATVDIRTFTDDISLPPGMSDLRVDWNGFDRMGDDRGYRYLRRHVVRVRPCSPTWADERLRLAFYPAVIPDASWLTLAERPGRLHVTAFRPPRYPPPPPPARQPQQLILPSVILDDITWDVTVPS